MSAQPQNINIGPLPNDGQGDPLRTAFTKINNNFSAVWAAGPVGSNITIINNTIAAENTNGGIALTAVGNGVITVNRAVVPTVSNTYDLGSNNLTYRAAWIGTEGIFSVGNITTGGDVIISNKLIVTPRTISSSTDSGQAGEISWDADYIYVCTAESDGSTNVWKRIELDSIPW